MRSQRNLPPSSLLANRHRPVPSQKISFTLSARLARKQKITPENGSAAIAPSPAPQARPSLCGSPRVSSPSAPGSVWAGSAFRHSCVRASNRPQHCVHVSRIGAARHPHLDRPHHDLDAGGTALLGGFVHLCCFLRYPRDKGWHLIGRQGEAAILGRPDPVRQMLWSEIMPSRYVRNHRSRRDRLGTDPPLLLSAPPSAADHARYLRAALTDLRVVTNVDHNVHTILYPKRIAIVHHSPSLSWGNSTAYNEPRHI